LSAIKEKYGPDAIQTTGSSRGTGNETNYVMQKFARAVIGTNNGARKFLHYIVGFVTRTTRGAGRLDGIRTVLLFDGAQ
ncbi:hypothetical protein, partial [Escherichia coli]|uniref:hypothetical protein n=1 Tax=Escherichia coli TaxID=562 RepID=UPI000E179CB9